MDMIEHVLRRVQSGETAFKPQSESETDIQQFQELVDAAIHAKDIGYLRGCHPLKESSSGRWLWVTVIVENITHLGRQYLANIDRNSRTIPKVISDSLFGIPASGDAHVDEMLRVAIDSFRKPDHASRKAAVEKLWDAWERLKTLPDSNPAQGNKILLSNAADDPKFLELLKHEADQLHKVGNDFHIRHFKTETTEITRIEHYDYLFHRLLAFMNLLLVSLRKNKP